MISSYINRVLILAFLISCCFISDAQSVFNKLVWSDEFDHSGLPDTTKWSYDEGNGCPKLCGWGNNEKEYYTARQEKNARIENGKLIIEARKEPIAGYGYSSARLVTKNKGDWKYGRIEIKAKISRGTGTWPAIWMKPTLEAYGGWPHSGEIDIMENVGYMPDSVMGSIHTGAYNGMKGTQKTKGLTYTDLDTAFHVYGIEWTAETITFFVDETKYHVFRNQHTGSETWPYDQAFYLILNIAVGGDWGGKFGVDDSSFPQRMEIDYVRVYQASK